MHLFRAGGHGYGLRPSPERVTQWPQLAAGWSPMVTPEREGQVTLAGKPTKWVNASQEHPMNSRLFLLLSLCSLTFPAEGWTQLPSSSTSTVAGPRSSGLQISLTTSAYQVQLPPPEGALLPEEATSRPPALRASVTLSNRGGQPIPFVFRDEAAANAKFVFSVWNASDELVWSGPGRLTGPPKGATGLTQALRMRAPWTATASLPLRTGQTWWAPGVYQIEAAVNGTPSISASGVFEILPPVSTILNLVSLSLPEQKINPSSLTLSSVTLSDGRAGLRIVAQAIVGSSHWSSPRLVRQPAATTPAGSLAYDFFITPPNGFAFAVISREEASLEIPWPVGVNRVIVRGQSDSLSQPLPAVGAR